MNTIKIRSLNAKRAEMFGRELTTVDKIILLRSVPHVHTELEFSQRYNNISFSFTMADNAKCGRFKPIGYSHSEYWDTIEIMVSDETEDRMYRRAKGLEGVPYDLVGLLSTISKHDIIKPSKKANWCTEGVNMVLHSGLPGWAKFLEELDMPMELIPCEMDMLARHYFKNVY